MEYTIITPIEKAAMAAVPSTGNDGIPVLLIIAALIAMGILIAVAIHEYEQSKNQAMQEPVAPQH